MPTNDIEHGVETIRSGAIDDRSGSALYAKDSDIRIGQPLDDGHEVPGAGGVLFLANRGDPPSGFDPTRTSSIALHHVAGAIFGAGNLVMRCRENSYMVCPFLASSWRSDSNMLEWIFDIRNDVFWHDGSQVTAEDLKFWFDLSLFGYEAGGKRRAQAYYSGDLVGIEKVESLPNHQLKITLMERNSFLLEVLANPRLRVGHPRHLTRPKLLNGELSVAPIDLGVVGFGPFRLDDYSIGSQITLERSENYFETDRFGRGLPLLDGIRYIVIRDAASMDAAFRTGRLDGGARGFGHYLTRERLAGYVSDLGDEVEFAYVEGGTFRFAFNVLKRGPWQDPRVRRAIALWIDKPASIPSVLGGFGWTGPGFGPPNPNKEKRFVVWPSLDQALLPERRAQALELISQSGYSEGFEMGHLCRSKHSFGCEYLEAQLGGLGIQLKSRIVDEGTWNQARVSLDYASQQGRLSVLPIPEGTEGVYGRYSKSPDAYAKHEDMNVDKLYIQLRNALSFETRVEVWRELQKYLFIEKTYVIPIAEALYVIPYRTYVEGLVIPSEDGHTHTDFSTVWIGERGG